MIVNKENFKQKRKELNLTQRQLARELGLSEKNGDRYIRGIESGDREPSGLLLRCLELYVILSKTAQLPDYLRNDN